jgi:hypothetical protein
MTELLLGVPFADMIVTGLALFGLSAALLIQCGNKRTAPKKKAIKPKKGSVKSSKHGSKRSSRSSKSKKGSVSKKSSRSSKRSKSLSKSQPIGVTSKPKQKTSRSSKRSDKESGLAGGAKTQQAKTTQAPQKAAEQPKCDDPSLKSLEITQQASVKDTRTALELASSGGPPELQMEPRELRFSSSHGGVLKVRLHNPTNSRQAFKVKCSDNTLYRVNPVYGFVEPGQQLSVLVVRQNGSSSKIDKLVFVVAKASGENNDFKKLFKSGVKVDMPLLVLPLIA